MRKKMLLLAMSLAMLAGSLSTPRAAVAGGTHSCPICTTYADGSQCCVSCICDASGRRIACTTHYCPPAGGID
jgi:hypothetical protein